MPRRYRVRGPLGDNTQGNHKRWAVVDTEADDEQVYWSRYKEAAMDAAREFNEEDGDYA